MIAAALQAAGPHPRPQGVRDALAAIGTTAPAYQCATGRIAFDANGDPVNKALLELHLHANGAPTWTDSSAPSGSRAA